MTKMFEEYWRGSISGAVGYFKSRAVRGEFTLVIEGKKKEERGIWTEEKLLNAIKKEMKNNKSAKDISAELAQQSGRNKKAVYALITKNKK